MTPAVLRYAAFTEDPAGGNPAGVVLDAGGMTDAEMQAVAAEVGYSETAFVTSGGAGKPGEFALRYFSPLAEVPFCGHATIATAVAMGGEDELVFHTPNGPVAIRRGGGTATLTSVPPSVAPIGDPDLDELLAALRWSRDELDPALPPRIAYAGVYHPVLAAATRERLAALDYDFDRLQRLMLAREWTTVQLLWRSREDPAVFHARDPFPPGGAVEDPATGAAAAALGGYLRALGLVEPPASVTVLQGEDMGMPARLDVRIPQGDGGIEVGGAAVRI